METLSRLSTALASFWSANSDWLIPALTSLFGSIVGVILGHALWEKLFGERHLRRTLTTTVQDAVRSEAPVLRRVRYLPSDYFHASNTTSPRYESNLLLLFQQARTLTFFGEAGCLMAFRLSQGGFLRNSNIKEIRFCTLDPSNSALLREQAMYRQLIEGTDGESALQRHIKDLQLDAIVAASEVRQVAKLNPTREVRLYLHGEFVHQRVELFENALLLTYYSGYNRPFPGTALYAKESAPGDSPVFESYFAAFDRKLGTLKKVVLDPRAEVSDNDWVSKAFPGVDLPALHARKKIQQDRWDSLRTQIVAATS